MKLRDLEAMAHGIKGPLSIIVGYGELLRERQNDQFSKEMAGEVVKAGARVSALIEDMLALARVEAGGIQLDYAPVSLQGLLNQTLRENWPAISRKGINAVVEVDPSLGEVRADPVQLARAVGSLVANAVRRSWWSGSVTVRAGRLSTPGYVFLEVSDTGCVARDDMPCVFDKRPGAGLGFTVAKAVVEAHGGTISIVKVEGEGATYRIILPVNPKDATISDQAA